MWYYSNPQQTNARFIVIIRWMEQILHQLKCSLSMFIPLFIGFQPSKVVENISTIHSMLGYSTPYWPSLNKPSFFGPPKAALFTQRRPTRRSIIIRGAPSGRRRRRRASASGCWRSPETLVIWRNGCCMAVRYGGILWLSLEGSSPKKRLQRTGSSCMVD